ncbi:MAG: DNA polymerase III subunit gamma/tau [Balneolaceae bacterium]|nr:DNA polymerase III subunit gamma/tau [Balneolaceae bacterium]
MSDNYRALTRTYRPHSFDDIVSQNHVSDTLKNAIKQNRLAHAYMFCGPRGVGKTTMARVLARTVNDIEQQVDGESLNQTLNVIEIDAASNNGVDDIRDLRERVRIPPQNGRYKIYIIDEVHMLSKAAFNALLKTLEEPPDHVIFIFATTEPHKVLPTILSRVQRFDFKRIRIDEIVSRLEKVTKEEGIKVDSESLHVIAKKADGALRDALGLLDQAIAFCGNDIAHEELLQALNVVSTDRMFEFMETVEQHDATTGLQLINELLQEGYDIQEFLVGLTEHLRNLYVARNSDNMYLVEASPRMKKRYKETAHAFSEDDLMRMLHIVSEAQYKIKEAHQPKIQFEITLLKLIHMERSQKLDTLLNELEQLKKKSSNGQGLSSPSSSRNGATDHHAEQDDTPKVTAKEELKDEEETGEEPTKQPDKITEETGSHSPEEEPVNNEETSGNSTPHDDFDPIFGTPSLGNGAETATTVRKKETAETDKKETSAEPSAAPSPTRKITLADVKENWETYVTNLKEQVPQMLYFQMQRVEPIKLKNRELLLHCNDNFAQQMVEEHKRELAKILEGNVGGFLRFNCKVRKKKQDDGSSMTPYERFKKLQQRDPKIKTLVELFGAELDYNLNQ